MRRTGWTRSTLPHGSSSIPICSVPFPEGYRHLGYLQSKLGFKVKRDLPQLKGAAVEKLYRQGRAWLDGAVSPFPDEEMP